MLRTYDTHSRTTAEFIPVSKDIIKIYICGLTVYDHMHIGHARTYMAFDVILRYLKYRGYGIRYVQNVTDIDDKIINRARERGIDPLAMAREYMKESLDDQQALGLLPADEYPTVTENIDEIIKTIQELIEKGKAYVTKEGNVYFDISTFPEYGKLSGQDTGQLSSHRIEPDPGKENPVDFSLWKRTPAVEVGFESPWGWGRPGWHIECSALARKYLGEELDIHGGALDLVFPHHENETAQSESLTGKRFARYWMHTGLLQSSGEKMSKSLGNILSVRDFLKEHDPEVLRLFVIQAHYRKSVDYSTENVLSAKNALAKLRNYRAELGNALERAKEQGESKIRGVSVNLKNRFIESMDNDFDTPAAISAVHESVREINAILVEGNESRESIAAGIETFDEIMGVLGFDLKPKAVQLSEEEIELIEKRNEYRKQKNWAEADRIRDLLAEKGILLKDRGDGSSIAERKT